MKLTNISIREDGCQIRIKRRGQMHTKFVSFKDYETREEAIEEAKRLRDEMRQALPEPMTNYEAAQLRSEKQNPLGVSGLRFFEEDGQPVLRLSFTSRMGERVAASRSIRRYGLRAALWNAILIIAKERELRQPEALKLYSRALPRVEETYKEWRKRNRRRKRKSGEVTQRTLRRRRAKERISDTE